MKPYDDKNEEKNVCGHIQKINYSHFDSKLY